MQKRVKLERKRKTHHAVELRQKLRQVISNSLPGLSTSEVYQRLKTPFGEFLSQGDLFPFCDAVKIERGNLPMLLSPYGVFNNGISYTHWKAFYEDQFCCSERVIPIPPSVTEDHQVILRRFANAIRARCQRDLPGQWQLIAQRNPSGTHPGQMRLSAICHMVDELSLAFDPTALIDALLTFFGRQLEFLNFTQFTSFMHTFD
jgi:hypothetical protein